MAVQKSITWWPARAGQTLRASAEPPALGATPCCWWEAAPSTPDASLSSMSAEAPAAAATAQSGEMHSCIVSVPKRGAEHLHPYPDRVSDQSGGRALDARGVAGCAAQCGWAGLSRRSRVGRAQSSVKGGPRTEKQLAAAHLLVGAAGQPQSLCPTQHVSVAAITRRFEATITP